MANLTVRNISASVFNKIKCRAVAERRSMNSEILILLEDGLKARARIQDGSSTPKI